MKKATDLPRVNLQLVTSFASPSVVVCYNVRDLGLGGRGRADTCFWLASAVLSLDARSCFHGNGAATPAPSTWVLAPDELRRDGSPSLAFVCLLPQGRAAFVCSRCVARDCCFAWKRFSGGGNGFAVAAASRIFVHLGWCAGEF